MPVTIGIRAKPPPHIKRKRATGLRSADALTASHDWYRFDWISPARRLTIQTNQLAMTARSASAAAQLSSRIHVTRSKTVRWRNALPEFFATRSSHRL